LKGKPNWGQRLGKNLKISPYGLKVPKGPTLFFPVIRVGKEIKR